MQQQPRVQFTIRAMMVAIAVVAGTLAALQSPAFVLILVALAEIVLAGAYRQLVRG